jgi:hypothetical protein
MSDALTKALAKGKDKPKKARKDPVSAAFEAFAKALQSGDTADAEKAFRAAVAEAATQD